MKGSDPAPGTRHTVSRASWKNLYGAPRSIRGARAEQGYPTMLDRVTDRAWREAI